MQFSLIIPTYNETRHLKDSLPALSAFFETHFKDADYEVLFIDDGSRDESAAMIENFGHPAFKVLSYGQNRGKGYAVRYGMLHAKGDIRIFTDCDLTTEIKRARQMALLFYTSAHSSDVKKKTTI